MADPTPYTPGYDYSNFEAANPTQPKPGAQLDNDFANIATSVGELVNAVKDVRRSDGKLQNGVVDVDSLDPDFKQDLYNEFTEGAAGLVDEAEQARDAAIQAKEDAEQAAADALNSKNAAANSAADAQQIADGAPWLGKAIGEPFPIFTHLGAPTPPTDNPTLRFIKLTASDPYNDGVLTGESVTGSAPLVTATAVIDYPDSPLHGQTVHLINTERRVLRAGGSGTLQDDALQNITGQFQMRAVATGASMGGSASGAFANPQDGSSIASVATGANQTAYTYSFDASRVARTADETRVRNIGADYFMRIY